MTTHSAVQVYFITISNLPIAIDCKWLRVANAAHTCYEYAKVTYISNEDLAAWWAWCVQELSIGYSPLEYRVIRVINSCSSHTGLVVVTTVQTKNSEFSARGTMISSKVCHIEHNILS